MYVAYQYEEMLAQPNRCNFFHVYTDFVITSLCYMYYVAHPNHFVVQHLFNNIFDL